MHHFRHVHRCKCPIYFGYFANYAMFKVVTQLRNVIVGVIVSKPVLKFYMKNNHTIHVVSMIRNSLHIFNKWFGHKKSANYLFKCFFEKQIHLMMYSYAKSLETNYLLTVNEICTKTDIWLIFGLIFRRTRSRHYRMISDRNWG